MIESERKCISIWDFHKGKLINKINVNGLSLYGFCLWNDDYFIAAHEDKNSY